MTTKGRALIVAITVACMNSAAIQARAASATTGPTASTGERPHQQCDGTTPQVNACLAQLLQCTEARLRRYVRAAQSRSKEQHPAVPEGIEKSQTAFKAYRDAECGTVFEFWKSGTIRTSMEIECRIRMTDARTRTVWENWLRYPDSTPPILPEPKPTL